MRSVARCPRDVDGRAGIVTDGAMLGCYFTFRAPETLRRLEAADLAAAAPDRWSARLACCSARRASRSCTCASMSTTAARLLACCAKRRRSSTNHASSPAEASAMYALATSRSACARRRSARARARTAAAYFRCARAVADGLPTGPGRRVATTHGSTDGGAERREAGRASVRIRMRRQDDEAQGRAALMLSAEAERSGISYAFGGHCT